MVPLRCLCSMEGPAEMLVTWAKGIKAAQETEVGNWLAFR